MVNRLFVYPFFIIMLWFTAYSAFSQDFPMLHYTEKDGLPSNNVYSIYRDSKGFLWLATDKGIARYNGIKFEIFTTFNGLPDNEIFFFHEDHLGRLWMGAYNGELCYYKNDTFHTAKNTKFLKLPFKASFVRQITSEKDSSINVIYTDNSKFLNIHNDQCRALNTDSLINKKYLGDVIYRAKISENQYKITFTNKILIINTPFKTENIVKEYDNKYRKALKLLATNYFGQNTNYIATFKCIYTPDLDTVKISGPKGFFDKKIVYFIYHNKNDWFFTTHTGIYINDTVQILKEHKVSGINQDNQGNYWATTLDDGIYVINKDIINAKVYSKGYENNIGYTYAYKRRIFFTTSGKKIMLIENGKIKYVCNYYGFIPPKLKITSTPNYSYIDSNCRFYDCYINGGIVIDNLLSPSVSIKKYHCSLTQNDDIHEIAGIGKYLFINTRSRVVGIDFNNFKVGKSLKYRYISDSLSTERIFAMAQAADNSVWYSTIKNVYKVENGHGILQPQFKGNAFRAFTFCGRYLVGCNHNNELLICNDVSGDINIRPEVIQNCIWDKFYKLDNSHVLAKTNNLYRIITLSVSDSVAACPILTIENPFVPLQAEAICTDSTNCYFFKNGSITSFDIKSLLVSPEPPKLFFKYLKTGKTSYLIHNFMHIPFVASKNPKVSFSTLSFGSNKVFYQYSISKNKQDNWIDIEGEEINLFNLGYGTSLIKIRAKTISSAWCNPIVFTLDISTPYWAAGWFIILSVCVAIIIVLIIVFVTRRLVLNAAKRRHEHVELELKSVYSQLNPHFIFNSLNAAMYLVKTRRLDDAYHHIYKFSHLLRAYIKSSRNRFIKLSEEIKNLRNYIELQQVRFKDKFDYEIAVSAAVDTTLNIPSLLLQPLVENAITHGLLNKGEKGYLKIEFIKAENNNELICIIDDNGIGRDKSMHIKDENTLKEESYGSQLIEDLIDILNKYDKIKIEIEYIDKKEPLTGTIVKLKIKNLTS